MILSPGRNYPVIDKEDKPTNRFNEWMEQVSETLSIPLLLALGQIVDSSRGDATINYQDGLLVSVNYADLSLKTFNYDDDGILTSISDTSGSDIEFVLTDGVLTEILYT